MTTLVSNWLQGLLQSLRRRRSTTARSAYGGDPNQPVVVYTAANTLEANLVQALLDSEGIASYLAGEALGSVYGLQVGPMAEVKILVAASLAPRAMEIIAARHLGETEWVDDDEVPAGDDEVA